MKRTSKAKTAAHNINKRILILCEGETEKEYFDAFKTDEELKSSLAGVDIKAYQPTDFSPLGLVKEAKRKKREAILERNSFDSIWIVFDKDQHYGIPEAFQSASDAGIKKIFSSVCFEYWVVLHFEYTTRVFKNSDEVVSFIKKNHYPEYKKGQECFTYLREKIEFAIKNASKIRDNAILDMASSNIKLSDYSPYTDVHELVVEILSLKK